LIGCDITVKKRSPSKFSILLKCIKLVKNWHVIPLTYYGLAKDEFVIVKLRNGLKIKLRTNSTDLQAFFNVWIIQEYQREHGFKINTDDVIIDIGGHIGLFTLYCSQFCRNGKIFSFEPIRENYEILLENIKQNDIRNVKPSNIAISNKNGKICIYLSDDQAAHSFYKVGEKSIEIETTTLENVIRSEDIEKCNLLKLDCEGAEYDIIDSLTDDITKKIEKISLEYHHADTKSSLLIDLKNKLKTEYLMKDYPSNNGMGILFAKHM
jgi:FkbM family methyltransferase